MSEESLVRDIRKGYLYYGQIKHRTEVVFDEDLSNEVKSALDGMYELYHKRYRFKFSIIQDASFKIMIGRTSQEEKELKEIEDIIKLAFERFGIGAKTSIGYGFGKVHEINYK